MKVLFSLLLSSALVFTQSEASQAQSRPLPRRPGGVQPKPRAKAPTTVMAKDGLTLQGGRVLFTELGLTNPLLASKKLPNGDVVSTTGLVTNAAGATTQLLEGDYISLTGRFTAKRDMVVADSVRKLVEYDLKHPGKRKELEKARENAERAKEKADKEKAKAQAKGARR